MEALMRTGLAEIIAHLGSIGWELHTFLFPTSPRLSGPALYTDARVLASIAGGAAAAQSAGLEGTTVVRSSCRPPRPVW